MTQGWVSSPLLLHSLRKPSSSLLWNPLEHHWPSSEFSLDLGPMCLALAVSFSCTVSPPLLEPSCVCRRHEDSTHHYTSPQSGARGAQECCPVVAETGSPWESLGPGFVLGPWPCKGSGVTAAVYLGSKPVVGFGQRFSALPWKWSQKLCQGHGCCLSYSKVLL